MAGFRQICCTHCTYGSSAFERQTGRLADRPLGYSVRAASCEGDLLEDYYRQIGRLVYYYLPDDTPGEAKLTLTAATSPKRFFYIPKVNSLQVVGQVCYRQTDSAGRPGSYFAHLLLNDLARGGLPWSALDCLRLWAAPGWIEEDSETIPHRLPMLGNLEEMLQDQDAAINDTVLQAFIHGKAARLLVSALSAVLARGDDRRPVVFVADPSLAAVTFYGIARLLPPGPVRDSLSFSTFESDIERACTDIVATRSYHCQDDRIGPDLLRPAAEMIVEKQPRGRMPRLLPYAEMIVDRLLVEGWPAADAAIEEARISAERWEACRDSIRAVGRLQAGLLGLPLHAASKLENECRSLAADAREAMQIGEAAGRTAHEKTAALRQFARDVLGKELLPASASKRNARLWAKIECFLETGEWPDVTADTDVVVPSRNQEGQR